MSEALTAERLAWARTTIELLIGTGAGWKASQDRDTLLGLLLDAAEENGRLKEQLSKARDAVGALQEKVNETWRICSLKNAETEAERDAALAQLAEWREVAESQAEAIRKHIVQGRLGLPTITDNAMARSANKSYALSEKYPKEASK